MRPVEGAVGAGPRRPREVADHVDEPEPRGDAQVVRLDAEQRRDLAVAPEERCDERRAAVAPGRQVGAAAGGEHRLGQLRPVRVAGLVELRPAVAVSAVGVGAALEHEPHDLDRVRHSEQVVAVRPPGSHELGMAVENPRQLVRVVGLDRPIGEHERPRRLLAGAKRLDVAAQARPGREAMLAGQLAPGLRGGDAPRGRDPVGAAHVVVDVGVERLFGTDPLDVLLEPRPAGEAVPAGQLELGVGELRRRPGGPALAGQLLGLLSELLEVRRCIHGSSFPRAHRPHVRAERSSLDESCWWGGLSPFRGLDAAPAAQPQFTSAATVVRGQSLRKSGARPIDPDGARGRRVEPRLVARLDGAVVGWAALSPISDRRIYGDVAEDSVYVSSGAAGAASAVAPRRARAAGRGRGHLEGSGRDLPENAASLALHERCGFRIVGRRERLGRHHARARRSDERRRQPD